MSSHAEAVSLEHALHLSALNMVSMKPKIVAQKTVMALSLIIPGMAMNSSRRLTTSARKPWMPISINTASWMTTIPGCLTHFGSKAVEVWYDDPPYYVCIVDVPDALSGDILRYKCDLPRYDCNIDIICSNVREIDFVHCPMHLQEAAEEEHLVLQDDAKELLVTLPLVDIDESIHFAESPRTRREIEVLQMCKGSPHFVRC